jgi:hypothetical protein
MADSGVVSRNEEEEEEEGEEEEESSAFGMFGKCVNALVFVLPDRRFALTTLCVWCAAAAFLHRGTGGLL